MFTLILKPMGVYMSSNSSIEWTEQTWNPVTGCTKVTAGCKHCYAEKMAKRLQAMGANGYQNGFKLSLMEDRLMQPLKRKKPTMYFVNSMSDLFHEEVPFSYIDKVMDIISKTPHHSYQILTKRAVRMSEYFSDREVPQNIWAGVTVENRKEGVPRIDLLRKINAKIRFLSIEPLLEDIGKINLKGIHWVIVGGESGVNARPMKHVWVESVKEQCESADSAFFFKQWGAWGSDGIKRQKHLNGRLFADKEWNDMPTQISA